MTGKIVLPTKKEALWGYVETPSRMGVHGDFQHDFAVSASYGRNSIAFGKSTSQRFYPKPHTP